jgi:hypothetical protein
MTADRLVQGLRERAPGDTDREQQALPTASILAICDRLLDEVGRRRHIFAWLRVPGAGTGTGEWLAVDAYYPRARLVVMCRAVTDPHEALYRELIPAHGLGLLMLDPDTLGDDPDAVRATLAAKLFDLEHIPGRETAPATARATAPVTPPPEPGWTPVKVERMAVAPAVKQGVGMVLGLALAAVLIAEVYLDVVYVFGAGRVMLAFAIAMDACSRALGTAAAARAGERSWACACAIGGAPVAAWYALRRRTMGADVEPAPLAGLLAGLAGVLALIALVAGA